MQCLPDFLIMVIQFITAELLWFKDNDSLASKPCLAQELLSDEEFVGYTAIVFFCSMFM